MGSARGDSRAWVWLPLVVGLLFPAFVWMLAHQRDGQMLQALAGYFSTVSGEPFWVVPLRILWNLAPFISIAVAAELVLHTERPARARAASLFATLGAVAVFVVFYADVRSALEQHRWTASAITQGMAPLYALPVSLVAFFFGWIAGSSAQRR